MKLAALSLRHLALAADCRQATYSHVCLIKSLPENGGRRPLKNLSASRMRHGRSRTRFAWTVSLTHIFLPERGGLGKHPWREFWLKSSIAKRGLPRRHAINVLTAVKYRIQTQWTLSRSTAPPTGASTIYGNSGRLRATDPPKGATKYILSMKYTC